MTAYSDDTSPPELAPDGVTIRLPLRGRTEDGIHYRGYEELRPGEDGYDELLPLARANATEPDELPERPVDPETLALILRDSGSDSGSDWNS
ncbi:hypothetical protein AB0H42_29280 [Nocardia sp. NPDC050799]|uniref:hypothetical protein n=1 Tax=Nocardia sp. NPDC050799 TaxID=3154842 RepID=UPI00340584FE